MGRIRTTYEIVTEESALDGDVSERGFRDEAGTEYTVGEAITLLRGCEPSSSQFHSGIWYTRHGEQDYASGDQENLSYHLVRGEWSADEEHAIYFGVTGKRK